MEIDQIMMLEARNRVKVFSSRYTSKNKMIYSMMRGIGVPRRQEGFHVAVHPRAMTAAGVDVQRRVIARHRVDDEVYAWMQANLRR